MLTAIGFESISSPTTTTRRHIVHLQMLKVIGDTMEGVNLAFLIISTLFNSRTSVAFIVNSRVTIVH